MASRATRTPRQIVTVEGREGQFLQVAVGAKNIRVKPAEGGDTFLVPAGTVTKVVSSDSAEKPVRAGMISLKRATYAEVIVIIVRSGRHNSRICEIGGTVSFVVSNDELSDLHEAVPAVEETVAYSDSDDREMITLTAADVGTIILNPNDSATWFDVDVPAAQ